MRLYDITWSIRAGMPVWPGDPEVEIETALSVEAGDGVRVSRLTLGTHTGTHVDAPAHIGQAGTVDDIPLERLVGPVTVVHWPHRRRIRADDLARLGLSDVCVRLLVRSDCPDSTAVGALPTDYATLTEEAGRDLLGRGLALLGTDAPSVDPFESDADRIHRLLLSRGVVIVEGLALSEVPSGNYTLCCLPLRLGGLDGAPARVILMAP